MTVKQLMKSILRARVLVVHPMIEGYPEPCAKHKSYLVLGSDEDIRDLALMVENVWPVRHSVFLI